MLSYRFNKPPGTQPRDAITKELAAQNDHDTEASLQGKAVQLGCLDDVGGVGGPKSKRHIGHNGNKRMLLDVEVSVGVQAAYRQQMRKEYTDGVGEKLCNE